MKPLSVSIPAEEMLNREARMDATYYASDVHLARQVISEVEERGIEVRLIGDVSEGTFNPPPIKRVFTDDKARGTPYMLPQEMFDFYWTERKYVLAEKMNKIEDWFLKDGWVVLTQSGSAGKPYFSTKADERVVLSQNAIRIPPVESDSGGYIYAFLSTWIGQTLLKKDEFGITVKHIRPNQVDAVPIPWVDKEIRKKIDAKVRKAFELRTKAIREIDEALALVYETLDAPTECPFDESDDADTDE